MGCAMQPDAAATPWPSLHVDLDGPVPRSDTGIENQHAFNLGISHRSVTKPPVETLRKPSQTKMSTACLSDVGAHFGRSSKLAFDPTRARAANMPKFMSLSPRRNSYLEFQGYSEVEI